MANRITIPKAHLITALCLPLAIFLGYMLAEPMESGSIAVVTLVLIVLAVPLMMKWHHPVLVLCWNAAVYPAILPGRPQIWILATAVAFFFALLNRSVNSSHRFVSVPVLTRPLLFFGLVVLATARR
ncbi:MAG TPA: hypothetical protein VLT36_22030, partial [Candidatus Dormibacteraeota bacterium]|nr:hypothetical protein [Candidatus Dormibacteraeota bacterium]